MTEFIEHIMLMFKIACYLCAAGGLLTLIYQGFQGQFNKMIFFATVAAAFLPILLKWLVDASGLNIEGML
jgi:ABC-type proline/glycine betaine transport system permease subunit